MKAAKAISLETPDQFGKTEKIDIDVEFEIEGDMFTLGPRVNQAWSENASLFQIADACGLHPNPNAAFDTDDLIGTQVKIVVETKEVGKWPRVTRWLRVNTPGLKQVEVLSLSLPDGKPNYDSFWKRAAQLCGGSRSAAVDTVAAMNISIPGQSVEFLETVLAKLGGAQKPHDHDWRYTPDGTQMVCRDCGDRQQEPKAALV
ncbi:MAG: hypothetical protein U0990_12755 [Candidatus Nanopelagicales bacterium]|nr:hypothetical protein [Candidatus Nanopelagicales bacterium]